MTSRAKAKSNNVGNNQTKQSTLIFGIDRRKLLAAVGVLVLAVAVAVFVSRKRETLWADTKPLERGTVSQTVACARTQAAGDDSCQPKDCGRFVVDSFVTPAAALKSIADVAMLHGEGNGATIFDLHSGALSKGTKFIDAYRAVRESPPSGKYFTRSDFDLLLRTKERIEATISDHFKVSDLRLSERSALGGFCVLTKHVATPTFFARLDSERPPKTLNDEYWVIF
jgi:hypothetical protein